MCCSCRFHSLCRLPHLHLPQKGHFEWLQRSEKGTLWLLFHPVLGVCPSPPYQLVPVCPPAQETMSTKGTENPVLKSVAHFSHLPVNREHAWERKNSQNATIPFCSWLAQLCTVSWDDVCDILLPWWLSVKTRSRQINIITTMLSCCKIQKSNWLVT